MDTQQVQRDAAGTLRCRECGFAYALTPDQVADRTESGLAAVQAAVRGAPEDQRARRPAPAVWSVNAYTAHLADAMRMMQGRIQLIAARDRPALASHDQDQAVADGCFDARAAPAARADLTRTAQAIAACVRALPPDAWDRVGLHSEAGEVRLSDIAHDVPHELEHHAGDIRRLVDSARS